MRPSISSTTWGFVYLLHFSRPLGNTADARAMASHYLGFVADDLDRRIAEHLAGTGARITRAAVAAGIEITLVATWRAPLAFEKYLKRRKESPRLCPICCRAAGRRVRQVEVPLVEQLALPFADDWIEPADLPAPRSRPTWDEIEYLERYRAAAVGAPILNFDDSI